MNVEKILSDFLIEQNCFRQFDDQNELPSHEFRARINTSPKQIIGDAFNWGTSKEGFNFWKEISIKWKMVMNGKSVGNIGSIKEVSKSGMYCCCENPDLYKNTVMMESFMYCRCCKKERI